MKAKSWKTEREGKRLYFDSEILQMGLLAPKHVHVIACEHNIQVFVDR